MSSRNEVVLEIVEEEGEDETTVQRRRRRKRIRSPTTNVQEFKTKTHSLRIPASRISALTGYHPFAILPELFLDFVYQGGHALKRQDARDLRMELVSTDTIMMELAQKAGADTIKAVQSAMQVKDGTQVLDNVVVAETLKRKVLEEATKSKKLSNDEIKRLSESTRSYIDTGFGTCHEDAALNMFEKQCGWQVRERNASILNWPFVPVGDVTVEPMGPAMPREEKRNNNNVLLERTDFEKMKVEEKKSEDDIVKEEPHNPFFIISGAVDGIRDELWCPPPSTTVTDDDDNLKKTGIDEDWQLRKVIVECKHRMRRAYHTPPLYDQIQTTAYCLMYDAEEADIIQVMRHEKKQNKRSRAAIAAAARDEKKQQEILLPGQTKIDNYIEMKTKVETNKESELTIEESTVVQCDIVEKEDDKENGNKANDKPEQPIEIVVSRVSLHDKMMNHGQNWHSIILPRLRSFVDAVYRVRANDDLRKLFLEVVATEEQAGYTTKVCWDMLHHELPWLQDCDTAYQ